MLVSLINGEIMTRCRENLVLQVDVTVEGTQLLDNNHEIFMCRDVECSFTSLQPRSQHNEPIKGSVQSTDLFILFY